MDTGIGRFADDPGFKLKHHGTWEYTGPPGRLGGDWSNGDGQGQFNQTYGNDAEQGRA